MTYNGLSVEQYKTVYDICKEHNKTMNEAVEFIDWICPAYSNIDDIIEDMKEGF